MAAVFVLGAAASAGYFAFSTRPAPATVQASPPPPTTPAQPIPPIIVQLVQPAATGALPMTGAVVTPAGVAAAALSGAGATGAGATGADSPDAWVLVGPPEQAAVTLLRQVEIPAAPQALTQSPETKPVKAEPKPTKAGSAAASSGVKIDLNTATQAQLESLPLVGPSMAKRIIEYRAANGPFKSVADLDKVKGIGEKTLAKLMPLVTVGDAGAGSR